MYLEKEFQILECELDIMSMELDYSMKMTNFLTEKTNDNKSNINRVVEYIKSAFKKLRNFLNEHFFAKKEKEVKEMISKDKKLFNTKIKIKDFGKVKKLDEDCIKDISKMKSNEDIEQRMNKYKKERDYLLKGGLPLITITFGTLIKIISNKNKEYDKVDHLVDVYTNDLYETNKKMGEVAFNSFEIDYYLKNIKKIYNNLININRNEDKSILGMIDKINEFNTDNRNISKEYIKFKAQS